MSNWKLYAADCDLDSLPEVESGNLVVNVSWDPQNVGGIALVPLVENASVGARSAYQMRSSAGSGVSTPNANDIVTSWQPLDSTPRKARVSLPVPDGAELFILWLLVWDAISLQLNDIDLTSSALANDTWGFQFTPTTLKPLPQLTDPMVRESLERQFRNFPIQSDKSVIELP